MARSSSPSSSVNRPVPAGIETAVREITRELRSAGTPERAEGEKRYLKSDFEFFGATLGDIRRTVRRVTNDRWEGDDDALALAEKL